MKILKNTVVVSVVVFGLVFARTGKNANRVEDKNIKVKNQHYWVEGHVDGDKGQLDRKRSHKRRRKIRKPVKGLR